MLSAVILSGWNRRQGVDRYNDKVIMLQVRETREWVPRGRIMSGSGALQPGFQGVGWQRGAMPQVVFADRPQRRLREQTGWRLRSHSLG